MFLEHDSAGDAGVGFPGGSHVGIGVSACTAEVFFEHEVAAAEDEETSVLGAAFTHLECGVEALGIEASLGANFGGLGE